LAGLIGTRLCMNVNFDLGVFACSSCLVAGMLASVAAVQFPYLLNDVFHTLTIYNSGSAHELINSRAIWWIAPFVLALGYNVCAHRIFRNRLRFSHGLAHPRPMMT